MRARGDLGETLIEILMTVVITGLTITALVSSLATAGNAGNVQRSSVRADIVMRNYAEATKAAAQLCVVGASYNVVYSAPVGSGFIALPISGTCPAIGTTQTLTLVVSGPMGLADSMDIRVRTP